MKRLMLLVWIFIFLFSSCSTVDYFSFPKIPFLHHQKQPAFEVSPDEKEAFYSIPSTGYPMAGTIATLSIDEDENIDEDIVYPDEEKLTTEEGIDVQIPEVKVSLPLPFPYPLQKVKFDYPVTYNTEVESWIKYFTGKGRNHFKKWLSRMYLYINFIKFEFARNGLPQDLAYLPLIESGFNVRARSPAWAVGMWQFMASTGRKYGLKINYWIDERRDPWKSTEAAIKYLKDLYSMFGDWNLAIAAYNAGEGKIRRAIRRYNDRNFWSLKDHRFIRRETANYVPKFIAALLIAKCPTCFGFNIEKKEPLLVEKVKLPFPVDLYLVSEITGVSLDTILSLNPELRHWVTPPNYKGYELKLPPGKGDVLLTALEKMDKKIIAKRYLKYRKKQREKTFVRHRMRWGETLSHVARRYRVRIRTLMRINHIRNPRRIRAGRVILVPVVRGRTLTYYTNGRYYASIHRRRHIRKRAYHGSGLKYRVRRGDTLWSIARKFGVSIYNLKRWNRIKGEFIKPGDILIIRHFSYKIAGGEGKGIKYTVREGDTLWDVSRKFGVSVKDIKVIKKKYPGRALYPGDVLLIEKD